MLANCSDIWKQDYAHLAPSKKMKKRDAFEEWLYRKKEEDIDTGEFRRYSIAGSAIPATERPDPIAWRSRPDIEEAFPTLQPGPSIYSSVQQRPANASEPLAVQRSSSHQRGTCWRTT